MNPVAQTEVTSTLEALWVWTPYLLGGFGWNILIAAVAMVLGTLVGALLAWLRVGASSAGAKSAQVLTELSRNVPTIVFQFYLAVMLTGAWTLPGTHWELSVPGWLKAALALAVAVVGFTSDNLAQALRRWRRGDHSAALLFVPSWASYLLIIVIASSTASIIGVSELVSRCNAVVNASANTALLVPMYFYASLIFLAFCYPLTLLMRRLRQWLAARMLAPAASTA
jgi:polar amino acid transport system permease protein